MRSVDSMTLVRSWGDTLDEVLRGNEAHLILKRGRSSAAVLMPLPLWQTYTGTIAVAATDQQTYSSDRARDNLRTLRDQASRGRHTMITRNNSTDPEQIVVLAPHDWVLKVLAGNESRP